MKNMTLEDIARACDGSLVWGKTAYTEDCATGVVIDSRKVIKGTVFIATRGARVDGHSFIEQVFEMGALGVICEKAPERDFGPYILVEDSFEALKKVAGYYRDQIKATVVGITGSVGKTSTKEFIASVLEQSFKTCKTQGNFNNEVGMPLTILQASEDDEMLVLEMGINHFGEMDRLSAISRPDIMVITNIGQCHLEYLGDRDGVLKAKTECFNHISKNATVILNGDDDKLVTVDSVNDKKPLFFGIDGENTYCAKDIESKGLLGTGAILCSAVTGAHVQADIPLPGRHMVYNAMAAMAVGEAVGMDADSIARGIAAVKATSGRSNIIEGKNLVIIDDCYNANPVSMKSAIELLSTATGRKVAILGDMFELGDGAENMHAEVGAYCAERTDVIVCIGQMSEHMYNAVCGGDMIESYYFETVDAALTELPQILKNGDSVLVKASNGMKFSSIVDNIINL